MAIHIKKSHQGRLHRDTGTPAGQPIPEAKKEAAAHSSNPRIRKEGQFALNAEGFHHGHSGAIHHRFGGRKQ